MSIKRQSSPSPGPSTREQSPTVLLWDLQECLPLGKSLVDEDLIILLTPVIIPPRPEARPSSDPFEPLGRALARKHPWIRHIPYTKDSGITGTHVAFVKRAKVVVFVLTTISRFDGVSQLDLAGIVQEVCEDGPMVVVACCDFADEDVCDYDFSTVVRAPAASVTEIEALTSLLMTEETIPIHQNPPAARRRRPQEAPLVESLDCERDLSEVHALWISCLPQKFHLSRQALKQLLDRDYFAQHHVARDPASNELVGFCAAFTTYANKSDDLIGSIAAIIVREDFRGRKIGRILHDEALGKLNKTPGVGRVQIGSVYPRLLYGIPLDLPSMGFFKKQGWNLDETELGRGRIASDWLLRFRDSAAPNLASAGLTFRSCQMSDREQVLAMASRISEKKHCFGWFDQYGKVLDCTFEGDVVVGFEGETLVATAITYSSKSRNPLAVNLPWAETIGPGIGGVSCICIKDDDPDIVNRRDSVIARLLQMCRQTMTEKGLDGIFVDGVRADENIFASLGFQKWAEYREVWRQVRREPQM